MSEKQITLAHGEQTRRIRALLAKKLPPAAIAAQLGIKTQNVYAVTYYDKLRAKKLRAKKAKAKGVPKAIPTVTPTLWQRVQKFLGFGASA